MIGFTFWNEIRVGPWNDLIKDDEMMINLHKNEDPRFNPIAPFSP
jgi:hypothetical protein